MAIVKAENGCEYQTVQPICKNFQDAQRKELEKHRTSFRRFVRAKFGLK